MPQTTTLKRALGPSVAVARNLGFATLLAIHVDHRGARFSATQSRALIERCPAEWTMSLSLTPRRRQYWTNAPRENWDLVVAGRRTKHASKSSQVFAGNFD